MANELKITRETGLTLYFLVWRPVDLYVWDAGDTAFEAPSTWNDARVGECDIALTEIAGTSWYQGTFPNSIPTGICWIQVFEKVGANPDVSADVYQGGFEVWFDTVTNLISVGNNITQIDSAVIDTATAQIGVNIVSTADIAFSATQIISLDTACDTVVLDTSQPNYAPSKAGNAMTLTTGQLSDVQAATVPVAGTLAISTDVTSAHTTTDTLVKSEHSTTDGLISGLNNLSLTNIVTACTTSLTTYTGPTYTQMVAAFTEIKGAGWLASSDTLEYIRNASGSADLTEINEKLDSIILYTSEN